MENRYRYIIKGKDNYPRLAVNPEVHALIKEYAKRNDITLQEATFNLLRAGLLTLDKIDI